MTEFEDIFYEYEDMFAQNLHYYLLTDESEMRIGGHPTGDCETGRISKLSNINFLVVFGWRFAN